MAGRGPGVHPRVPRPAPAQSDPAVPAPTGLVPDGRAAARLGAARANPPYFLSSFSRHAVEIPGVRLGVHGPSSGPAGGAGKMINTIHSISL